MDSAIYALVYKILDSDVSVHLPDMSSFTNVDFYGNIINEVLPLIEAKYTKAAFKEALDHAIQNLKITKAGHLTYASFSLFNLTYKLPSDDKGYGAKAFAERIRNCRLYKEL